MSIEHTEEAYLRPLDFDIAFVFRFQNIKNNANSVLVVVSNDSLICIGCIRLDNTAFLLTRLRWLMVLQLDGFWVQWSWVLSKKQRLYFYELDVLVFIFFT